MPVSSQHHRIFSQTINTNIFKTKPTKPETKPYTKPSQTKYFGKSCSILIMLPILSILLLLSPAIPAITTAGFPSTSQSGHQTDTLGSMYTRLHPGALLGPMHPGYLPRIIPPRLSVSHPEPLYPKPQTIRNFPAKPEVGADLLCITDQGLVSCSWAAYQIFNPAESWLGESRNIHLCLPGPGTDIRLSTDPLIPLAAPSITVPSDQSSPISYSSLTSPRPSNKTAHITYGNNPTGIKILTWNKGSAHLSNRIDEVRQLVHDERPHLLSLQEAQISQSASLDAIHIEGYRLFTDPIHRAGGNSRTCLYVHNDLTVTPRPDLEDPSVSLIAVTVGRPRQRKFNYLTFYRQWRIQNPDPQIVARSATVFSQSLRFSTITDLWAKSIAERETITASDTNLSSPLLLDQDVISPREAGLLPVASHYHNKILTAGVAILNKDFTHFSPQYPPAILDHLTSTHSNMITNVTTTTHGRSDHKYLTCFRLTKAPVSKPRYRVTRNYRAINPLQMSAELRQSPELKEAALNTDPTVSSNLFISAILQILDTLAPAQRIQIKSNGVPYLSVQSRELQRRRDNQLDIAHITNHPEDWRYYRSLRNQATESIKCDQNRHLQNKVDSKNPGVIWQAVRNISGILPKGPPTLLNVGGIVVTSPRKIASAMNQFFINKIQGIISQIPVSHIDPLAGLRRMMADRPRIPPLQFRPVSRTELLKIIRSMRPTKSVGVDGISMKIIKDNIGLLAPAIHNIVNQSILHNTFPEGLKTSKVIPIIKPEKSSCDPASYRPINILPALSKIIEKTVFKQLTEYIDKLGLISHHHHGSTKGHSPATALLSIYQQLTERAERGDISALISLDQSAAYDIVSHLLLMDKLKLMGLSQDSLSWIQSFLADRLQVTEIESYQSDPILHPPCSIIQGSVGSCILYQLYTVDLPQALHQHAPHPPELESQCDSGSVTTYVDDGNAVVSARTPQQLMHLAQRAWDRLSEYLSANRLKWNSDKTKLLVHDGAVESPVMISFQAGQDLIEESSEVRLLGIQLTSDLKWTKYVAQLRSQMAPRISTLRKLAKHASFKQLKQVATAIILGKLNFALSLWGGLNVTLQQKLQTILLSAARACLGPRAHYWSTQHLLTEMNWLGISQQAEYVSSSLLHQVIQTAKPSYVYSSIGDLRPAATRAAKNLSRFLPNYRLNLSRLSFSYRAVLAYNTISASVKSIKSKKMFKKKLRQLIQRNRPYRVYDHLKISNPLSDDHPENPAVGAAARPNQTPG